MKKYNNIIYLTFFFILFNLTFYRDYLYIYRMMLVDFVPYDHYQNQLLFFITEEDESKLTIPAALRLLQILYFYVIYLLVTCITLSKVAANISLEYQCVTSAVAIGNLYLIFLIISGCFFYFYCVLKKKLPETLLVIILLFGLLHFADHFAVDRFAIFYIFLILIFYENIKIALTLVVFSFLVSEKIFLLFFLYSIIEINLKNKFKINFFIMCASIFSFFLYLLLLFYFKQMNFQVFDFQTDFKQFSKIFYDKSSISGGLIPLIVFITPYFFIFKKEKKSFLKILLPLSMTSFSIFGGVENLGRYLSYSIPFFIMILSPLCINLFYKLVKSLK